MADGGSVDPASPAEQISGMTTIRCSTAGSLQPNEARGDGDRESAGRDGPRWGMMGATAVGRRSEGRRRLRGRGRGRGRGRCGTYGSVRRPGRAAAAPATGCGWGRRRWAGRRLLRLCPWWCRELHGGSLRSRHIAHTPPPPPCWPSHWAGSARPPRGQPVVVYQTAARRQQRAGLRSRDRCRTARMWFALCPPAAAPSRRSVGDHVTNATRDDLAVGPGREAGPRRLRRRRRPLPGNTPRRATRPVRTNTCRPARSHPARTATGPTTRAASERSTQTRVSHSKVLNNTAIIS